MNQCTHVIPGWVHTRTVEKNDYYSLEEYTTVAGGGRLVYINKLKDGDDDYVNLKIPEHMKNPTYLEKVKYLLHKTNLELVLDHLSIGHLPEELVDLIIS